MLNYANVFCINLVTVMQGFQNANRAVLWEKELALGSPEAKTGSFIMSRGGTRVRSVDATHNHILPTAAILMILYCYREGEKEVSSVYRFSKHPFLFYSFCIVTVEKMEMKNEA